MEEQKKEKKSSPVRCLPNPDEYACAFAILPRETSIFCRSLHGAPVNYFVLDSKTLEKTSKLRFVGHRFIDRPAHQKTWKDPFVYPGFETVELIQLHGEQQRKRRMTILVELMWHRGTGDVYILTNSLDFKKQTVRVSNQRQLPVRNGSRNWQFHLLRDTDDHNCFHCLYFWPQGGKVAVSLARIEIALAADSEGKEPKEAINCEAIADARIVQDTEGQWGTGRIGGMGFVMKKNIYLMSTNGPLNRLLRNSFDNMETEILSLKPFLGEFPFDGYNIQGWFDDCLIAFIHPANGRWGKIWALDVGERQWLDLGIVFANHVPMGDNKMTFSKIGQAFLLAYCSCPVNCHIYTFDVKDRLRAAREAVENELKSEEIALSMPSPQPSMKKPPISPRHIKEDESLVEAPVAQIAEVVTSGDDSANDDSKSENARETFIW